MHASVKFELICTVHSDKQDALDNFRFVMAICTGQYICLLLWASLYVLLNWFNIDTGIFFRPKVGRAFLIVAYLHCFRSENGLYSTGSMTS